MEQTPLSLVLVAHEKELKEIARALKSVARKVPFHMQCTTQAIDGPAAFNVADSGAAVCLTSF